MITQPIALQLAEDMNLVFPGNRGMDRAAAELRRLYAENAALLEALRQIGQYTGEGSLYSTPWQEIVTSLGEIARAAIAKAEGEQE